MGQALDAAIKRHGGVYPGSEVYAARVSESETGGWRWRVEVYAEHFSVALVYNIGGAEVLEPLAGHAEAVALVKGKEVADVEG